MFLLDLFLLGTLSLWFIPFFLLSVVAITFFTEEGMILGSVVSLGAALLGFQFLFGIDVFGAIWNNPLLILVAGFIHIAIGSAYTGFWKFPDALSQVEQSDIDRAWKDFKGSKEEFAKSPRHNPLHPRNFLQELSSWVLFWPFAMGYDLLHRPIRWLWNTVYDGLAKWFDRISAKATSDRLKDK